MSKNTNSGYGTIPSYGVQTSNSIPFPSSGASNSNPIPIPSSGASNSNPVTDFISCFKENGRSIITKQRPWRELVDLSAFARLSSFAEAMVRIRLNYNYFRGNYNFVILLIMFLRLLWHPYSMIVILIVYVAWFYFFFFRDEPLVIYNQTFDDRSVLIVLSLVTFVVMVLTHMEENVSASFMIGMVIVGLHATFRITEDQFLDEQEAANGGLISVVESPTP